MIPRFLEETIFERLTDLSKVILILGVRQVGKTTLLSAIQARLANEGKRTRHPNCDLQEDRRVCQHDLTHLAGSLAVGTVAHRSS